MTAQSQLEAYLGEFRQRLKALIVARGAAMAAVAALVVTLLAVYFGIRRAFDPQIVISARVVLLLLLAGIAVALVVLPLRALRRSRGIKDIERRAPDFNGRLETYDGIVHGPPERATPFLVPGRRPSSMSPSGSSSCTNSGASKCETAIASREIVFSSR